VYKRKTKKKRRKEKQMMLSYLRCHSCMGRLVTPIEMGAKMKVMVLQLGFGAVLEHSIVESLDFHV
tara:strand:- start:238 stop:435 length:198 start_codon:yes stop_codon:yes gene_type:complete